MPPKKKLKKVAGVKTPIPDLTKYDGRIMPYWKTKANFKNFRQWIHPHRKKERLGGYLCKTSVSPSCVTKFADRKTKETLKEKQHYSKHGGINASFKQVTKFFFIERIVDMKDGSTAKMMLLVGEQKLTLQLQPRLPFQSVNTTTTTTTTTATTSTTSTTASISPSTSSNNNIPPNNNVLASNRKRKRKSNHHNIPSKKQKISTFWNITQGAPIDLEEEEEKSIIREEADSYQAIINGDDPNHLLNDDDRDYADRLSYETIQKYKRDYYRFKTLIRKFKTTKDINLIKIFVREMKSFNSIQKYLMKLIKTGKYQKVKIGFKENIQNIVHRKYSKREKIKTQDASQQKNEKIFWRRIDNLSSTDASSTFTSPSASTQSSNEEKDESDEEEDETEESSAFESETSEDETEEDQKEEQKEEDQKVEYTFDCSNQQQRIVEPASAVEYTRVISCFSIILNKYINIIKYNQALFHKRRHRGKVKKTDEYKWNFFHFPQWIFKVTELNKNDPNYDNDKRILLGAANDEIEAMYTRRKHKTRNKAPRFLFTAAPIQIREQFIIWKSWIITYLQDAKNDITRMQYNEHYFENEYDDYIKICQDIEQKSKEKKQECKPFLIWWDIEQSKVYSSSAYIEAIGGKSKAHKQVEYNTILSTHPDGSRETIESLIMGVSDHLVDDGKGVVMGKTKTI